jgi:hypothetical protein
LGDDRQSYSERVKGGDQELEVSPDTAAIARNRGCVDENVWLTVVRLTG